MKLQASIEHHKQLGRKVSAYASRYDDGDLRGYWFYVFVNDGEITLKDGFVHTASEARQYAKQLDLSIEVESRTR